MRFIFRSSLGCHQVISKILPYTIPEGRDHAVTARQKNFINDSGVLELRGAFFEKRTHPLFLIVSGEAQTE